MMYCPFCKEYSGTEVRLKVLESRVAAENTLRRRRECPECEARFTTCETILSAQQLLEGEFVSQIGNVAVWSRRNNEALILRAVQRRLEDAILDIEKDLQSLSDRNHGFIDELNNSNNKQDEQHP